MLIIRIVKINCCSQQGVNNIQSVFLTLCDCMEKTLKSPLDCKEIQPVYPKGDQSWVFIGRTDVEAEIVHW